MVRAGVYGSSLIGAAWLGVALAAPPAAAAVEAGRLGIELNKLEEVTGACRAYLVFENGTDSAFAALKLDLVMFGPNGVIAKRLAVDGAPVPAGKTVVKLFDIQGLGCADVARILINDVMSCRDAAGGERSDCITLIEPSSRSDVTIFK